MINKRACLSKNNLRPMQVILRMERTNKMTLQLMNPVLTSKVARKKHPIVKTLLTHLLIKKRFRMMLVANLRVAQRKNSHLNRAKANNQMKV